MVCHAPTASKARSENTDTAVSALSSADAQLASHNVTMLQLYRNLIMGHQRCCTVKVVQLDKHLLQRRSGSASKQNKAYGTHNTPIGVV